MKYKLFLADRGRPVSQERTLLKTGEVAVIIINIDEQKLWLTEGDEALLAAF